MGSFDPVPWDAVESTIGPPAPEITEAVDRLADELTGESPYDAVKTVHDHLYDADVERTVPNVGEPFITAYLLEKRGVISAGADADSYPSLVDRRPSADRLRTLFWEDERTLWWIGVITGVHPSLVTYWCYEDDIPLMERNYRADSLKRIQRGADSTDD